MDTSSLLQRGHLQDCQVHLHDTDSVKRCRTICYGSLMARQEADQTCAFGTHIVLEEDQLMASATTCDFCRLLLSVWPDSDYVRQLGYLSGMSWVYQLFTIPSSVLLKYSHEYANRIIARTLPASSPFQAFATLPFPIDLRDPDNFFGNYYPSYMIQSSILSWIPSALQVTSQAQLRGLSMMVPFAWFRRIASTIP